MQETYVPLSVPDFPPSVIVTFDLSDSVPDPEHTTKKVLLFG